MADGGGCAEARFRRRPENEPEENGGGSMEEAPGPMAGTEDAETFAARYYIWQKRHGRLNSTAQASL